jgi:hypothetical protein
MKNAYLIFILISVGLIPLASNAFGHGLGMDMAPPVDFEGMQVTVMTTLEPRDITVGTVDSANIGVRFYDTLTDKNLNSVTYRIEVWRNEKLLARNLFYDVDGQLDINVRPQQCFDEVQPWKCTIYFGERDLITDGLMARGGSNPIIQGPIFDKGGLYNINVVIEGATSPKALVAEPLIFETFVSIAQDQNFLIKTAQAQEIPVVVKTYYDEVSNFKFDPKDTSLSFDMPFNWDPQYVSLVQVVHEEIRVPKSFSPYGEGKQFKGYINGVEVDNRVLLLDPYSYEDQNVIHFLVTKAELERINNKLGPKQTPELMTFKLVPQTGSSKNSLELSFESGATGIISWDGSYGAGQEIPFEFSFFDKDNNLLRDVHYGYEILDENGNQIAFNIGSDPNMAGILASEGLDVQKIKIPTQDQYKLRLLIIGQGMPMDVTYSGIVESIFEVGPAGKITTSEIVIPNWIKNNARWWAEGNIGDSDFVSGIQYLIKEGIMRIPPSSQTGSGSSQTIPTWIKNNAKWWAEGQITDNDFVQGIQYLVRQGIIKV